MMLSGTGNANVNGNDGVAVNPYGESSSSSALVPMDGGASKI